MVHCMIIDRSGVVRKVAKRILTSPELSVVEAENGVDALEMCKAKMPETILLDAGLANGGAMDFIRAVRALEDVEQPTIVLTMSELDLVAMTKAKRVGADDFLLKPFDRKQLTRGYQAARRAA